MTDNTKQLRRPTHRLMFRGVLDAYSRDQAYMWYNQIKSYLVSKAGDAKFSADILEVLDPCCDERKAQNVPQNNPQGTQR